MVNTGWCLRRFGTPWALWGQEFDSSTIRQFKMRYTGIKKLTVDQKERIRAHEKSIGAAADLREMALIRGDEPDMYDERIARYKQYISNIVAGRDGFKHH